MKENERLDKEIDQSIKETREAAASILKNPSSYSQDVVRRAKIELTPYKFKNNR